ncbi:endocuticle structural glycoprotein SgAbd-5-like [Battus philenor]|uniref:endocuticle structural glycoprotein SgAbd-5-like n=1 Tax=Battus philenor TaxID=42288 RepID=UPI0035CF00E9
MMYRFLLVLSFVIFSTDAIKSEESDSKIIEYENNNDGRGNYHFRFVTSNGITREETGSLINDGLPNQYIYVVGSYSYTDTEGVPRNINYVADINGYVIQDEISQVRLEANGISGPLIASLLGK